ncbi:MAG: hypothetical protein AB1457_06460 [Chloroflexota bacterium]
MGVLLFPALADESWFAALVDWFNPALDMETGYWFVMLPALGLPVLGGAFAYLEGGFLFKGQMVRHSIAFLLAYPLPRWQVYLSRVVYLLSGCFLLSAAGFLSVAGMNWLTGNSPPAGLMAFFPATALLVFLFGELGVLLGILTKSVWLDRLVGLILMFLVYLPYGLSSARGAVRYSPLFYVLGESPLTAGFDWVNLLVLGLLGVVIGLIGGFAFEHLDLE